MARQGAAARCVRGQLTLLAGTELPPTSQVLVTAATLARKGGAGLPSNETLAGRLFMSASTQAMTEGRAAQGAQYLMRAAECGVEEESEDPF